MSSSSCQSGSASQPPDNAATATEKDPWTTSVDKWDELRPVIEELYINQNKQLKEVTATMARDHKLRGTVKMYKNRITKWGLDKKNKESEVRAIVRKKFASAAVGKSSEFRIRGRPVDPARIEQYLRKKGMTESQAALLHAGSATPPAIECRTPPHLPVPGSPSPPPGLRQLDMALTSVRDYYVGSFSAGTWMSLDPLSDCASIRPGGNEMVPLKNLYSSHDTACSLFDNGQFQEGGKVVLAAFGHIKDIITTEHPRTIGAIFDLSMFLRLRGRPEIANMLIRQFSSLTNTMLPATHPLARIFRGVTKMDDAEIEEASVTVWTCALDQLDTALGPFHYTSLRSRTEFIQMAEVKKGMDVAESSLRRLLDGCKTRLGMADARTLKLLDTLAELVLGHGNYQLADELADDLIACAPLATPWSRSIDIWVAGLFVKARVQKQLGQTEMALATLQEAIDLNVSQWGWSYALTLKYLVYQETWLVEISEHERASEVKRLRIGALELSEKKS